MKGPRPKSGIWDLFVKLAFSVNEALKTIQIDKFVRYITMLVFNIYFALGSQITIDLKKRSQIPDFVALHLAPFSYGTLDLCIFQLFIF